MAKLWLLRYCKEQLMSSSQMQVAFLVKTGFIFQVKDRSKKVFWSIHKWALHLELTWEKYSTQMAVLY